MVSAPRLKGGGELVIALHDALGGVVSHLHPQLGQLLFNLVEAFKGGVQHVLHGVPLGVDGNLGDEAHPLAGGDGDGALIRLHLPGDDAEDGGLAGAVAAQQPHPLPGIHLEGKPVQDFSAHFKFFDQAGQLYINHSVLLVHRP